MKKLSFVFLALSLSTMLRAQINCQPLIQRSSNWTANDAEHAIEQRLPFEYRQQFISQMLEEARTTCNATLIFHSSISWDTFWDTGVMQIDLEQSSRPFDLFYTDSKCRIKYIFENDMVIHDQNNNVVCGQDSPSSIHEDKHIATLMIGVGKRMEKAFRRIIREHPDVIFKSEHLPYAFLFINEGTVYIYDCIRNKKDCLISYPYLKDLYTPWEPLPGE